jgi:hypothetical protein
MKKEENQQCQCQPALDANEYSHDSAVGTVLRKLRRRKEKKKEMRQMKRERRGRRRTMPVKRDGDRNPQELDGFNEYGMWYSMQRACNRASIRIR